MYMRTCRYSYNYLMIFRLYCRNTPEDLSGECAFIKYVEEKGFKARDVPKDGHCQFHAISDQFKLKNIEKNHEELRKMAVDQLRNNPERVSHS